MKIDATDTESILTYIKTKSWDNKIEGDSLNMKWISINAILSTLELPFDAIAVATKCAANAIPGSKYYGKSVEEIVKSWNDKGARSANMGNDLDMYVQCTLHNKPKPNIDDPVLRHKCNLFDTFNNECIKKANLELVGTEIWLTSKTYGIRGRADAIFLHNGSLVIFDWKNTDKMNTNTYVRLLGPCEHMAKSDLLKYTLQGYLYKFIIEGEYDMAVKSIRIIQFSNFEEHAIIHKPLIEYDASFIEDIIAYAKSKLNQ